MKSQIQIFFRKSKATLIEPLEDFFFFLFFFFFDWIKTTTSKRYFYTMNTFLLLRLKLFEKRFCVMIIVDYFCIFWGGEATGETQTHLCEVGENFWENGKANFLERWRLHRQNFSRARTSEKPCKGRLNKTYV